MAAFGLSEITIEAFGGSIHVTTGVTAASTNSMEDENMEDDDQVSVNMEGNKEDKDPQPDSKEDPTAESNEEDPRIRPGGGCHFSHNPWPPRLCCFCEGRAAHSSHNWSHSIIDECLGLGLGFPIGPSTHA